ncbi:MAG: biopolymer transporter ExbD, partial [bacterium]|nr:biopolymer transporter ExbD [bacterium]
VSSEAVSVERELTEIIVNVTKDGKYVVNQAERSPQEIEEMLVQVARVYRGSHIIIRGDQDTSYRHIVRVLDACKKADIWNVSFAVIKVEEAPE